MIDIRELGCVEGEDCSKILNAYTRGYRDGFRNAAVTPDKPTGGAYSPLAPAPETPESKARKEAWDTAYAAALGKGMSEARARVEAAKAVGLRDRELLGLAVEPDPYAGAVAWKKRRNPRR